MAITVLITLTTAGIDSGPFNLYSDVDGYLSAFESGIGRAALLAGYSSALVPDGTTTIRLMSVGNCTNYVDLAVVATTTTTTTGPTTSTTTSTSSSTTSTTTAIPYNLTLGQASCRWNNCNDNAVCAVEYEIDVTNDPVGSYLTVTKNSGTADVSIAQSSPPTGRLYYTEPDGSGTVNFTIFLRDSGGGVLDSITLDISHQSFWQFLDICTITTTTTSTTAATTTTTTTAAPTTTTTTT